MCSVDETGLSVCCVKWISLALYEADNMRLVKSVGSDEDNSRVLGGPLSAPVHHTVSSPLLALFTYACPT